MYIVYGLFWVSVIGCMVNMLKVLKSRFKSTKAFIWMHIFCITLNICAFIIRWEG